MRSDTREKLTFFFKSELVFCRVTLAVSTTRKERLFALKTENWTEETYPNLEKGPLHQIWTLALISH